MSAIGRCMPLAALAAIAAAALPVAAHDLRPQPVRELVRIQGYKAPAPAGVEVVRELTLGVLGEKLRFSANEWRSFAFFEPSGEPPAEPSDVSLQGERALLRSIATARPDQRISILAERRPGAVEMFLLAVDLCPPH